MLYFCGLYTKGFDTMINRVLIRLKTVQVIYAYYQNGGQKPAMAERELAQSLDSAYSLYKTMLYLPVALTDMARLSVERQRRMNAVRISRKEELLAQNLLAGLLENNQELGQFVQDNPMEWLTKSDFIKETYAAMLESDAVEEYTQAEKFDFASDRELWKKLYKSLFQENESLDSLLEEQNIYWNGDRDLIDSFVIKTIRSMSESDGPETPLLSEYKDEEDGEFAIGLLRAGLQSRELREELVAANCRRWDPSRLAFLDVLIIQTAIGELLGFPDIPVKVTINEYVEMAKILSTPQSGAFVNGMLDAIAHDLSASGKLDKEL